MRTGFCAMILKMLREKRRLIIAPLEQSPAMQRNGHQVIRFGPEILSGAVHPGCKRRGGVRAVAVFEPEDQPFACVIIQHGRTRGSENGRIGLCNWRTASRRRPALRTAPRTPRISGAARKWMPLQQAGHSAWFAPTGASQDRHSGGSSRSSVRSAVRCNAGGCEEGHGFWSW